MAPKTEQVDAAAILIDLNLAQCSAATQGVWFRMLLTMWANNRDSLVGTPDEIARQISFGTEETLAAIKEMEAKKVALVEREAEKIEIVCKRLRRRTRARELTAERQRRFRDQNLIPFAHAWEERTGGGMPWGEVKSLVCPLLEKFGFEKILTAWRNFLKETPPRYISVRFFAGKWRAWEYINKGPNI